MASMFNPNLSPLIISLMISFTFACSRPATCALEGCTNNDVINLSTDGSAMSDADAIPQIQSDDASGKKQGELEKKLDQVLNRLGLAEALAALHSKTLELHEQRLTILEGQDKDKGLTLTELKAKIAQYESMIAESHQEMHSIEADLLNKLSQANKQLEDFKAELAASNEIMTTETSAKLDALQAKVNEHETNIAESKDLMKGIEANLLEKLADANDRFEAFKATQESFNTTLVTSGQLNSALSNLHNSISTEQSALRDDLKALLTEQIGILTSRLDSLPDVNSMNILLTSLASSMSSSQSVITEMSLNLNALIAQYSSEIPAIHSQIETLNSVDNSCIIGESTKNGNSNKFRTLTCGEISIDILEH